MFLLDKLRGIGGFINEYREAAWDLLPPTAESDAHVNTHGTYNGLRRPVFSIKERPLLSLHNQPKVADAQGEQQHMLAFPSSKVMGEQTHDRKEQFLEEQVEIEDIPLWNKAPRERAPLMESEAVIGLAPFDKKTYLAIYLSASFVAGVADIVERKRAFDPVEALHDRVVREIETAQQYLEHSDADIRDALDEESRAEISNYVARRRDELEEALQRKRDLDRHYELDKLNLKWAQTEHINRVAELLLSKGLIAPKDSEPALTTARDESSDAEESDQTQDLDDEQLSVKDNIIQEASDRWYAARNARFQIRQDFENRHTMERNQLENYRQGKEAGDPAADFPEEEMDLFFFEQGSKITRALIEIDHEYREATKALHALGYTPSLVTSSLQTNLPDHPNDGYRESFENDMIENPISQAKVEVWLDIQADDPLFRQAEPMMEHVELSIPEGPIGTSTSSPLVVDDSPASSKADKEDHRGAMDVDEWDALSLAFGEAISTKFPSNDRQHEQIVQWHAHCEEVRHQFTKHIQHDLVFWSGSCR